MTQYYPPEMGAAQGRLSSLAGHLRRAGYRVTVLTGMPNYPQGKIFDGYRVRLRMQEEVEGIRVIRTWIYASKKRTFIRRLMNYFSFVFSSVLLGAWKLGPQDIILVESPPLFLGLSAVLFSRLKGAKLVFNVSDLWPASAVEMGLLKNRLLIGLSESLEKFLYRRSDLISGQTQGIVDNILEKLPGKQLVLLKNGVDLELFPEGRDAIHRTKVRKEFGLEGKFVVGYAGLHGLAQGLETVLEAAKKLRSHEDITFAFFGDGPEKDDLLKRSKEEKLTNIRFYPAEPVSRMPHVLAAFDMAIIPLRRIRLFRGALPSKMFEAMAAQIPLVVSVQGEARCLVEESNCGLCVEPEDPQAMAQAILDLYKDESRRRDLGLAGRRYVVEHRDRAMIAKNFSTTLLEICT